MRIVVNDIAASYGGAMTILKQFYNYVKQNDINNEWIFILSDNYLEETENIKIRVCKDVKKSGLHKLYFDFVSGKKYINQLYPDVVLSLQNIITFGLNVPQVVYIHQSIPFQKEKKFSFFKSDERSMAVYQYIIGSVIKYSAKKADAIIVQTNWMKNAVMNYVDKKDKKFIVALPDVEYLKNENSKVTDNIFFEDILKNDEVQKQSFFYPTTAEIYKNINVLVEAVKILNDDYCNKFALNLTLPKNTINVKAVECIGRLNPTQMKNMYCSSVLVFPSYIETVGLPLLEAKSEGCFILAADCEYAHEILSDYPNVRFFNPWNPEELAELMKKIIDGQIEFTKLTTNTTRENKSSWNDVINLIYSFSKEKTVNDKE